MMEIVCSNTTVCSRMHYVVRMQSLEEFAEQLQPRHTHSTRVTAFAAYILLRKIEYGPDIVAAAKTFEHEQQKGSKKRRIGAEQLGSAIPDPT